jgi:hypothetical protein
MPTPSDTVEEKYAESEGSAVAVEEQARNEKGQFTKADDTSTEGGPEVTDDGQETETDEEGGEKETSSDDQTVGLDLESEDAPIFNVDESGTLKFTGGQFLGKYDTVDDALKGHKHALRELGKAQHELQELRSVPPTAQQVSNVLPMFDPADMTDDQLTSLVLKEIQGDDKEVSFEEKVAAQDDPGAFLAKNFVKAQRVLERMRAYSTECDARVKRAYPKIYDRAKPEGERVLRDFRAGRLTASELKVILGQGLMARDGTLSGKEEVVRVKPKKARSPVATATRTVRPPKKEDRAEQKQLIKEMQGTYGD